MKIRCPDCAVVLGLKEIKPVGAPARCAKCGTVWRIKPQDIVSFGTGEITADEGVTAPPQEGIGVDTQPSPTQRTTQPAPSPPTAPIPDDLPLAPMPDDGDDDPFGDLPVLDLKQPKSDDPLANLPVVPLAGQKEETKAKPAPRRPAPSSRSRTGRRAGGRSSLSRDRGSGGRDRAAVRPRYQAPSQEEESDSWTRKWANICGGLLIGGFLIPIVVPILAANPVRIEVFWMWDLLDGAPGGLAFAIVMPVILGIAIAAIGNFVEGEGRAIALLVAAPASLFISLAVIGMSVPEGSVTSSTGDSPIEIGKPLVATIITLIGYIGAILVAVGNRLRKLFQRHPLPRNLAGYGGCALAISLLIPFGDFNLSMYFDPELWKMLWAIMLTWLGMFVYAGLGISSFFPNAKPATVTRLVSLAGRVLIFALPIAYLITMGIIVSEAGALFAGNGMDSSTITNSVIPIAGTVTAKIFLIFYGHVLASAVGLAALLELKIRAREQVYDEEPEEPEVENRVAELRKRLR